MERKLKKILIVTNLPTPYKIDFYKELGRYCDLTVIVEARRLKSQQFNWNDVDIKRFQLICLNSGFLNEKKINFSILKYLRKSYDRIVMAAYYMPTELLALSYLKLMRIPYWFESDGGMINRGESEWNRRFKNFMIGGAEGYLSPSSGTDEYLSYYKADPLKIHRYPFTSIHESDSEKMPSGQSEKQLLRKELGIAERRIVLAVGQFIPRKGFDVLMKAAARMSREIGFYIVGGEPTDEYIRLQKELDLPNVHFEGFKTKKQLVEYFRAADLFVLPTREDIWGLVINEAMACGLPVVTTRRCVAGVELLSDSHCLVEPDDVEGLGAAMSRILDNGQLSARLAVENLNRIKDYTIEKMAAAHARILGL